MAIPPSPDSRFIEALTRHQPVLEAYCHANLARREDAWEVLQKTNIKLWEKSADWNPEGEFLPWAFAVARFTILSYYRDQSREKLIFDPDVAEKLADESQGVSSELPERQAALARCLAKLGDTQRALLHAYYADGQSLREIAQRTHRGESALKMLLLRLRRTLGDCIQIELRRSGI